MGFLIGVCALPWGWPAAGHARPQGYNGEWVAFETDRDGNREVYLAASDGSGTVRNVTQHASNDGQPSWAHRPASDEACVNDVRPRPSSHFLAFQSDRGGTPDIYLLDAYAAAQAEPIRVTDHVDNETAPAMAPPAANTSYTNLTAYASDASGPREIYLSTPDRAVDRVNVSNAPAADDTNPDWSLDGRYIAFESDRGGTRQIWVVRVFEANGTLVAGTPYPVTRGGGAKYEPSWVEYQDPLPQGVAYAGQIVYSVEQGGRRYLDIAEHGVPESALPPGAGVFEGDPFGDPAAIQTFPLTGDPGDDSAPNWSPIRLDVVYASTRGGATRDLYSLHGGGDVPLGGIEGTVVRHPADDTNPDWQPYGRCAEMQPRPPRPAPGRIARTPGGSGGRPGGGGPSGGGGGPPGGQPPGGGPGPVPPSRCTKSGTRGKNTIRGTRRADVICGFGGNDRIYGGGGRDIIDGGSGHDRIYGGTGNDRIVGGSGRDTAFGENGNDSLSMKDRQRDRVSGGRGRDVARVDRGDRVRGVERRLR